MQPARFFYIYIWIYLTDRVDTYRIVLNVSTRLYFSVYATISLEPRASLLCLTRSPCLLTPCTHLGHRQLRQYQVYNRPFLVLERNRLPTTTLYVSTVNHVYATWYGASLCSSVYTSTCRFAERAVLRFATGHLIVSYIRCTESHATNRIAPGRPKCLALH